MSAPRPSSLQISLGRLQRLEKEFQDHKDFWTGQAPHMRVIMETTQLIQQGLIAALTQLDQRQGQAIQALSKRIDGLLGHSHPSPQSPQTAGAQAQSTPARCEAIPGTTLDALIEEVRALCQEVAGIKEGQARILSQISETTDQIRTQAILLARIHQRTSAVEPENGD